MDIEKCLYGIFIFIVGVIVGWLNPIEGPLDWTYDEYASHPAHKSPVRAAPAPKEEKPILWWFFEEEEEENTLQIPDIKQQVDEE